MVYRKSSYNICNFNNKIISTSKDNYCIYNFVIVVFFIDIFSIIIDIVDKNIAMQKSAPVTPLLSSASVADELTKLAKLKESGILSEEEFNAQKSKLLNL